jgi:two-component system NarL family response regulator
MKVLIVDDHRIVRAGLRALLEREASVSVVGEASDGREALRLAREMGPDVVLMDVSMPGLNGIDATRLFVAETKKVKVIGLTMNADRRYVLEMLSAGAAGYLVKSAAADELLLAIRAVMDGKTYLSEELSGLALGAIPGSRARNHPRQNLLSSREREVLQLLSEGLTSKDIAARLFVAVSTVETHRKQIMSKLNLRSVAELTKYAVREGLTTLE